MKPDGADYRGMAKQKPRRKSPISRQFRLLYIGQWIRALGARPVDIAKTTGINEGYLSELINGRKKNPSGHTLAVISDFLGIPMSYLYRPPPSQDVIESVSEMDPAVLSRLQSKKYQQNQ